MNGGEGVELVTDYGDTSLTLPAWLAPSAVLLEAVEAIREEALGLLTAGAALARAGGFPREPERP